MPRRLPALLVLVLGLSGHAAADPRVDEVLAADRAFAVRSGEAGAQAAFLEILAPDAVLFRPTAVNGRDWLRTHEEATGRLDWSPATGRVSCDGRLAVTLGPWTYRQDALVDAGSYLTVWRRNAEGNWNVAVDHGVDGPAAAAAPSAWTAVLPAAADGPCPGGTAADLARADEKLNDAIDGKGMDAALRKFAGAGTLVLRDGHAVAPLAADWPRDDAAWPGVSAATRGSQADAGSDLGYTHGELMTRGQRRQSGTVCAVFLRIWERRGHEWRLLADMTTAVNAPPATQ